MVEHDLPIYDRSQQLCNVAFGCGGEEGRVGVRRVSEKHIFVPLQKSLMLLNKIKHLSSCYKVNTDIRQKESGDSKCLIL